MTVFEKIEAQQAGKENTPAWMVGEQLKEICKNDDNCAQIVFADLENPDMSIEKAEKKIRAHADELHAKNKGNCVCVAPHVAEKIIREFYGLPEAGERKQICMPVQETEANMLDLSNFF